MSKIDQVKNQIKASLDKKTVAELLSFIGYEVRRDFKFSIRDERTPSVSIRADGYIKDFGNGWSGDLLDLLQDHHNYTYKESIRYIAGCLGIDYE